jgi:hypothetical protein
MSKKQAHARRHAAAAAHGSDEMVEIRVSDWGPQWVRLEDVAARLGQAYPLTEAFLDYCIQRGYVREADMPGPDDAVSFRKGSRYWRSTPGLHALFLAGAVSNTPVPPSLRDRPW